MANKPPYVFSPGTLTKALEKIKVAPTPERVTQDFVNTKLGLKGGSGNAIIPFFKRAGLLSGDGTPTDLYRAFRNPTQSGRAMAGALKSAYKSLYELNEYVHDLKDPELKGLMVQATGLQPNDRVLAAILGSFRVLRGLAKFDDEDTGHTESDPDENKEPEKDEADDRNNHSRQGISLSYTVNLNLPATTDVKVFDAIFRSLKEHLLKQ
jgi:hypothetical protein